MKPRVFDLQQHWESFWHPPTGPFPSTSETIMAGKLFVYGPDKQLVPQQILMTSTRLIEVYQGNSGQISFLEGDLSWVTVDSFRDICNTESRYGFTIMHKREDMDFFVADAEDLERWMDKLRGIAVLNHIEDDYQVKELLGEGGQSIVSLAISNQTHSPVAIKTYSKSTLYKHPKRLSALISEIEILRVLSHPNIVKLLRVYESDTSVDLVMEYVPGLNLADGLQTPYSESEAAKFMLELLETMIYLDKLNVVHRDIKPSNIILPDPKDRSKFKLIDFGLAKKYCGHSFSDTSGSPGFMAPEILTHHTHGPEADIYSAGILYYTLLVGHNPFVSGTVEQTIARNTANSLLFPSNWTEYDPKLECMIRVMTNSVPKMRMNLRTLVTWMKRGSLSPVLQPIKERRGSVSLTAELKQTLNAAKMFHQRRASLFGFVEGEETSQFLRQISKPSSPLEGIY